MLKFLYNEIFYKPLLNGLVFFTSVIPFHDVGFAIIILTVLVKIILFPLTHRSIKTQIKMKRIEPELKKIKQDIQNRQKQAEEILKVYRAHGISPYSGFLMLLIQLPILIALYSVFWKGISFDHNVYSFLNLPEKINLKFLGIFDVTKRSIFLTVLSSVSQFFQIQLSIPSLKKGDGGKKNDFNAAFASQMKYFMPVFIFIIAFKLPSAVSIYWTTMNIFAIVHEGFVRRKLSDNL